MLPRCRTDPGYGRGAEAGAFKLLSQIADAGMEIKVADDPLCVIAHQCSAARSLVGLLHKINSGKVKKKSLLLGNVGQQRHVCSRCWG